jgi:uncharacterized protein YerC
MAQNKNWPWDKEVLLLDLILSAKDRKSLKILLNELLTPQEKARLEARVSIAKALLNNITYDQIETTSGASSYMIARTRREIVNAKKKYITRFLSKNDLPK